MIKVNSSMLTIHTAKTRAWTSWLAWFLHVSQWHSRAFYTKSALCALWKGSLGLPGSFSAFPKHWVVFAICPAILFDPLLHPIPPPLTAHPFSASYCTSRQTAHGSNSDIARQPTEITTRAVLPTADSDCRAGITLRDALEHLALEAFQVFTQPGAQPSTAITWDPHGPRAFALLQHHIPSEKGRLVQHDPVLSSNLERVLTCEYAEPCPRLPVTVHATHEPGQRRMMRAGKEHASSEPTPTRRFVCSVAAGTATPTTFAFSPLPLPDMGLTFLPRPQPWPRKRSRAAADIDGEHSCMQKKKRRLRLFLITSRLSPQFSHPATNIVDKGFSKIAVWAKQRSLGRNLLRKAAILNHIRRAAVSARIVGGGYEQVLVEQEEQKELAMARLQFNHGSVDTYTRPVLSRNPSVPPAVAVRLGARFVVSGSPPSSRSPSPTSPSPPLAGTCKECVPDYQSPNEAYAYALPPAQIPRREYIPLPPSPLGLSNYDEFDTEENVPNPYSHLDDEDEYPTMHLFDNDEGEDADIVPFSPSAVTSTSSSTLQTRVRRIIQTAPDIAQSNLDILDHGEPVLGDYDQVQDGTDTLWLSVTSSETPSATTGSTRPGFNALFATAPSKRSDSFATSPNF